MRYISKEVRALVVSAAVLIISVGLMVFLTEGLKQDDNASFIAILMITLIAYAIASGRLSEFRGPGGWGAKFRDATVSQVEPSGLIENADELEIVQKGGLSELQGSVSQLNRNLPNALILQVGRVGYYDPGAIKAYLHALIAVGTSSYVIFIEKNSEKFVGSAHANQILATLESDETKFEFMRNLESGERDAFAQSDFLVRDYLTPSDNNKTALEKFLITNADALTVVERNKPTGIVDRNRLVTKLMVNLAGDGSV